MPLRFATIDIGTNTTIMLVAEAERQGSAEVTVLAERAEVTRLGRGIGKVNAAGGGTPEPRPLLLRDNIDRTLDVLREFAAVARRFDAPVVAVGTEGLRRAGNAADFLIPAAEILGVPVEIVGGDREAALSFLAAARSFPRAVDNDAGAVVVDIGGGSTEIIVARGGTVLYRHSLPLGSVRLTERFIAADPPTAAEIGQLRAEVARQLQAVPLARGLPGSTGPTLIGTAGTVTTLAAMAQDLHDYDASKVHGFRLSTAALAHQLQRLSGASQSARETFPGLDPRRADVITAGAHLLDVIAGWAEATEILVSDRGIRWGLLYECLGVVTARLPSHRPVGEPLG